MLDLDSIDRRLLALLQAQGRVGFQDLGEAVGLSGPAAFQRVRKLEGSGVIRGYAARVDPGLAGRPVAAFLRVRPGPTTDGARLVQRWAAVDEILECHRLSGEGGYLLKLRVPSLASLTPHIDAARRAGCVVSTEVSLGSEFERWAVPVSE